MKAMTNNKQQTMKANELRIGNLVLDNLGGTLKILAIGTDSDLPHITGMKITNDWLLSVGFTTSAWDNHSTHRKMIGDNDYTIVINNDGTCDVGDDVEIIDIKYVHQIQNLYFALTGEELTYGGNK
jgi:hypothetical protein